MLPARNRLRARRSIREVLRTGRRGRASTVVIHLHQRAVDGPPQVGFAVSKAVGNSVVRHRVTRRLRAILVPRLPALPAGSLLMVRALPLAASARSADLAADVDAALTQVLR